MLKMNGCKKIFRTDLVETQRPLIDLNLNVKEGDFGGRYGPSGSGKTTFLI